MTKKEKEILREALDRIAWLEKRHERLAIKLATRRRIPVGRIPAKVKRRTTFD